MKKTFILLLASISASLITPAFGLGVRVGSDSFQHKCEFINPRVTSKVKDCESANVGSVALFFQNSFPLKFYTRTELGSVSEQKFTSFWAPRNTDKQEITIDKHLRAILSVHRDFNFLLNTRITPMIGIGYASVEARGAQGANNAPFKAKTNRNSLEVYGVSFAIKTLPFFALDYRIINYGDVRTGVGVPSTNNEILHGALTSQHIGISFSF